MQERSHWKKHQKQGKMVRTRWHETLGESFYEACDSAVNWIKPRFLLTMLVALNLCTRSIDFTIECLQATLKKDDHVQMTWGYEVKDEEHLQSYCLKSSTNWNSLKDGGLNWLDFLKSD